MPGGIIHEVSISWLASQLRKGPAQVTLDCMLRETERVCKLQENT